MDLASIRSGKKRSPRRILIYGTHGIGKSTFGAMADSPIFIPTEDGLDDIDCKSFPVCRQYSDILSAIGTLYAGGHPYRTVVIDSADWLERLIWGDVCRARNVGSIEDIGFAKGYTFSLTQWQEILDGLNALREKGMTIILVAHAKIEKFENPETESYDRYSPRLHKLASHLLQEWCDEVLFANYKVFTTSSDEGFGKTRVKATSVADRVLRTCERPAHVAKNRLGLPEEIPLDWREYAKYLDPDPASSTASQIDPAATDYAIAT